MAVRSGQWLRHRPPSRRDLVTAALWVLAVVPQAFGFWLVAANVAGVPSARLPTMLCAALLTLGIATLAQVCLGYRVPLYEGPASAYLAALVVSAASRNGLAAFGGGLLAAGILVATLGLLRFDRLLRPLFTRLTAMVFVLVVCIAVLPAVAERAIGSAGPHAWGTAAAWMSTAAVLATGAMLQHHARTRPYALLGALLVGTGVHIALAGVPSIRLSGGLTWPQLLPWGPPQLGVGVVAPFAIAGLLAAYNTIAAIEVMGDAHGLSGGGGAARRGLAVHGAVQATGAVLGNVLGTVARLDSVPILDLLGNRRRVALALAAVAVMVLASVRPVLELAAALPLNVSAALLGFMLGSLVLSTLRRVWQLGPRARWIVVAAIAPSVAWTPLQGSLSATAQLLGNPMLWGVAIGIVLERRLAAHDANPARSVEAA